MKKYSANTDWIGRWFEIQAERGHEDEVPFYLARPNREGYLDFGFRHRDQDGVAAMTSALASLGLKAERARKKFSRPPFFLRPVLLWRGLLGNNSGGRPNWRHFSPEKTQKARGLRFLVLGAQEERALADYLAARKVSLTAYLLSRLTLALESTLLQGPAVGSWLLPVDMRPAFPDRPVAGNCVSYVRAPAATDAKVIHLEVARALRAYEHWANWWIYHIGLLVGIGGMRWLSRRAARRTFWLGSFTDLGDWTPLASPEAEKLRDSVWAVAAPGTPNNPVGCATVAWFGQRTISLRFHPSVNVRDELCADILRRLARLIHADIGLENHAEQIADAGFPQELQQEFRAAASP